MNTRFAIAAAHEPDDPPATLELIEVTSTSAAPGQEQFSLLFRASPQVAPAQGLYELSHPELGELPLFLVPVSDGGSGFLLEAVVNRVSE